MPDRSTYTTYTIVVERKSTAWNDVYAVEVKPSAINEYEAAIEKFRQFLKEMSPIRPIDVWQVRLVKHLEQPNETDLAEANESDGFKIVHTHSDSN